MAKYKISFDCESLHLVLPKSKLCLRQLEIAKQDKKKTKLQSESAQEWEILACHGGSLDTTSDLQHFVLVVRFLFINHIDKEKSC